MAIVINGSGTVTGLSVGGLPDGTVDDGTLANNAVTEAKIATDAVTAAKIPASLENTFVSGRKNLIINGAMNVKQRGSILITDAGGEYTLDRFQAYWRGGALATATQDTDVPAGQGFSYSIKMDVTTGDSLGTSNDLVLFRQKIEGQDLQHLEYGHANAKTMTLTFWIKSTVTGTYILRASQADANDRINSTAYTVSSANTWEKKTITIAGDTSGAIDNNTGNGLELAWCFGSGSDFNSGTRSDNTWIAWDATKQFQGQVNAVNSASNNIYITGVQLEVGDTATDFEHRSFNEELALCERYYQKTLDYSLAPGTSTNNGIIYVGGCVYGQTTSGYIAGTIQLNKPMRATPTIQTYDGNALAGKVGRDNYAVNNAQGQQRNIQQQNDRTFQIDSSGTHTANVLIFHYTADAEL